MTDLSKRANLQGVREVRGLVSHLADSPTSGFGADWAQFVNVRADGEADSEFWTFRGDASVVGHDYTVRDMFGEFTERIAAGAFDKTLSEGPAVMLNYMHNPETTMVTTARAAIDDLGGLTLSATPNLTVEARIPKGDADAQRIMPKVQRGDASSMSFAFRVTQQVWNEDYTDRTITEVNLHRGDVAVIVSGLGANPAAWGTVRALRADVPFMTPHDYMDNGTGVCQMCSQEEDASMHNMSQAANSATEPDAEERAAFLRELVDVQLRNREN